MRRSAFIVLPLLCSTLAACGGASESDVQDRIDRERAEAKSQAVQEQRLAAVQDELKELKKEKSRPSTTTRTVVERESAPDATPSTVSAADTSSDSRTFHAPSGNVSCRITSSSAACAVVKAGSTFAFAGGPARQTSGLALGRNAGTLVGWGESVSLGAVSCSVPPKNVAAGITCRNSETGAGFEASAVPSRQKAY